METINLEIPNLKKQIAPYENEFIKKIENLRDVFRSGFANYDTTFEPPQPTRKFWREEQVLYDFDVIPKLDTKARMIRIIVNMEGKIYFELFQDTSRGFTEIEWKKVHVSQISLYPNLLRDCECWIEIQTLLNLCEELNNFFKWI